jgi:galactonate dehydratase
VSGTASAAATAALGAPWVVRAQTPLTLHFRTIKDPDGWHASLRLKGDWLVLEIGDGVLAGFGEASHSNDDERCKRVAAQLFEQHYGRGFTLSLESLARKEQEIAASAPDFVTATAFSALNQALYDLLAKREQVPVWRLFRSGGAAFAGLPLYTTINRALQTRSAEEYFAVLSEVQAQGFKTFKCAPFEAVNGPDRPIEKAAAGLATLARLREQFPDLAVRVDFHERFQPQDFFALIPELERLQLAWIEEPFAVGPAYDELRRRTHLRIAGGELFWGRRRFEEITEHRWVDVIMPDVKHVGGFGPLLDVLKMGAGRIEISPHNPSGPISTAASLHAAAVYPELVRSLEYSFDRTQTRGSTGERIEDGVLSLGDEPGWGVAPPA